MKIHVELKNEVVEMDCIKIGNLIARLRKERNMTQKNVADALNISNKTVSKWECGMGCPDLSLWSDLSDLLGADLKILLEGELFPNLPDQGNIKKIKFHVCPACGNILTATSTATISCCGRTLNPLTAKVREGHELNVQRLDNELYVTFTHEMKKSHYIVFVAYVVEDKVILTRLYPEQAGEFRLPDLRRKGKLYAYCNVHGLWEQRF